MLGATSPTGPISKALAFTYPSTLADSFHSVTLTITLGPPKSSVTLTIDDSPVVNNDLSMATGLVFPPSTDVVTLGLGLVSADGAAAWNVHIDDVTLDVK